MPLFANEWEGTVDSVWSQESGDLPGEVCSHSVA